MMGSMGTCNKLPHGTHVFIFTKAHLAQHGANARSQPPSQQNSMVPMRGLCVCLSKHPHQRWSQGSPQTDCSGKARLVWWTWILKSNCIYGTQKSPETSQLWDHNMSRKQGNVFVTKLSPHLCAYIVICAETGIGITCGSQIDPWNCPCKATVLTHIGLTLGSFCPTYETPHVKPLFCHRLAPHGIYVGQPMKLPLYAKPFFAIHSHCMGFTLVDPWNCLYKTNIVPNIGITRGSLQSAHKTAHVKPFSTHLHYMEFMLIGP